MAHAAQHCDRPWWKRPPVWLLAIAAMALLIFGIVETAGGPAATPYGTFLDQLDAGNVASVVFRGTEIDGHFKHPLADASATGTAPSDAFRSRVPDFGDPALIPALRKQHVAIEVASSSSWTRLLAGLPWPMLLLIGVMLIAGFVRFMRGKGQSSSDMPMAPMQGMMGLVAGLFAKPQPAAGPPTHDSDSAKHS